MCILLRTQSVRGACWKMVGDRGGHISLINLLYWILSEKIFHEREGSCKARRVPLNSTSRSLLEEAWTVTHDARPTTHDSRPTTHPATPISQSRNSWLNFPCLREWKLLSLYIFHRIIFLLLIFSSLSRLFSVVQGTSLAGVLKMPRVSNAFEDHTSIKAWYKK